jgi:uncharacterized protein (DUF302 family)
MVEIGMRRTVAGRFDDVLARIPELLKDEGFGVLTRIDVTATLKEKLGVDFRRHQILGACNPKLAHEALSLDPGIGVLLPCNVVLWENDGGGVTVSAVDPMQTVAAADARFQPVAAQVKERLARVLSRLGEGAAR